MQKHPHTRSTAMVVLTPLAMLATQFNIPIYAVYRIALRLGITLLTTGSGQSKETHLLQGMESLAVDHPDAIHLYDAIRLLKEGVHISAVHHLLRSQEEIRLLKQTAARVTTLHALVESGKAWMPHPVSAPRKKQTPAPSAFKRPKAHQAIWAMPTPL